MPTRAATKTDKNASRSAPAKAKTVSAKPAKRATAAKASAPKPVTKATAVKTAQKAAKTSPSTRKPAASKAAPAKKPLMTAKTPAPKSKPAPRAAKKASSGKAEAAAAKTRAAVINGQLSEDQIRQMSDDDYMNEAQLSFFRERLMAMRAEVLAREVDVKERLHQREVFADPADRATAEEEHWLDLRLRERESLLLRKIDEALKRIVDREYGYCEKTGDPIGIPRLLARPTATVCVDIKGQDERVEAQYRDR